MDIWSRKLTFMTCICMDDRLSIIVVMQEQLREYHARIQHIHSLNNVFGVYYWRSTQATNSIIIAVNYYLCALNPTHYVIVIGHSTIMMALCNDASVINAELAAIPFTSMLTKCAVNCTMMLLQYY